MAPHSSTLAWRILWTGEPGGLPSMGSHRVGHDWSDLAAMPVLESKIWEGISIFTLDCSQKGEKQWEGINIFQKLIQLMLTIAQGLLKIISIQQRKKWKLRKWVFWLWTRHYGLRKITQTLDIKLKITAYSFKILWQHYLICNPGLFNSLKADWQILPTS